MTRAATLLSPCWHARPESANPNERGRTGPASASSAPVTPRPTGPTISITDSQKSEGTSRNKYVTIVFTFTLSQRINSPVTLQYATADGTALAGSDYIAKAGNVTFKRNKLTAKIKIKVRMDVLNEANETFLINLWTPSLGLIVDDKAIGLIIDDD